MTDFIYSTNVGVVSMVNFLHVLLPTIGAYRVPTGIGTPSRPPLTVSAEAPRTLADAAASPVDLGVDLGGRDVSQRPLNLDFVPRLGWKGTVFPSVASPLICSVVASAAALILHDQYGFTGINPTAHQVAGVLVSFLAVFRTQQAYNRYWEGRGHLGLLMAGVVDLASLASVQLAGGDGPRDAERVAAARIELARLLRLYFRETVRFLRTTSRTTQRVSNYWLPEEAIAPAPQRLDCDVDASEAECSALAAVPRPPVLVLQWIRAHLYRVGVEEGLVVGSDAAERTRTLSLGMDVTLAKLQPSFNGAAKIATTPAPQPYTQASDCFSLLLMASDGV